MLVDYSDSDSEVETLEQVHSIHSRPSSSKPQLVLKRKRSSDHSSPSQKSPSIGHKTSDALPPLPSTFHDLYASAARASTTDDPSLHGGRKRVTPHVEGLWPTHLYLEWFPTPTENERLVNLISSFDLVSDESKGQINTLLTSDLGTQLPLHISLSRPVNLHADQREPFLENFRLSISQGHVRPFKIRLTSLDWVGNYEQTRWFLVVRLAKPEHNALNHLLRIANRAVQNHGQLPLYAAAQSPTAMPSTVDRRGRGRAGGRSRGGSIRLSQPELDQTDYSGYFHISIGWSLQPPTESVMEHTRVALTQSAWKQSVENLQVRCESVKVKVGNAVHDVPLPSAVSTGKGLLAA